MLAAITCHFNPIQYENIIRNYWMFREDLKGVDLFTIELSFTDQFEIKDATHVKGSSEQIMWQKERLLNLLIEQLPSKYDKIAWLDGDIIFENDDWAKEAEKKLDDHPMIQLFEEGHTTGYDLEPLSTTPGIVYAGAETKNAHPGLAWAARRSILAKTGLLDTHIMGGGDNMMYFAAMGFFNTYMLTRTNLEWRLAYMEWARPFYEEIKGNLGNITGNITHLYHGTYADRQYVERWIILSRNSFNPNPYTWVVKEKGWEKTTNDPDIRINKTGIWEWASDKPDLHDSVAEYFEERKEDEQWITSMNEYR